MEMYLIILAVILINESDLILAHLLLNFWQRQYAYCFVNFPEFIFSKAILFINLKIGNGNAQPKNQT